MKTIKNLLFLIAYAFSENRDYRRIRELDRRNGIDPDTDEEFQAVNEGY